jgi:hypothetical protein
MKRRIKETVPDLLIRSMLGAMLVGLIVPGVSHADHVPDHWRGFYIAQADWNQLSDDEKAALQRYRGEWQQLPPERRERIRQGADRYQKLTPEQRERVERARERYREMPEDKRREMREQFRRSHGRD